MSTIDPGSLLNVPGRLSYGCTDLTTAWPHGGTGLGLTKDHALKPARAFEVIRSESYGEEAEDVLDLGESWVFVAVLRTLDVDAVRKVFPGAVAGTSGKPLIRYPGTFTPGTLKAGSAIKLVFTPDDESNHPFAILYKAVPLVDEAAEIATRLDKELGVPVVFQALVDTSSTPSGSPRGRAFELGWKGDVSL